MPRIGQGPEGVCLGVLAVFASLSTLACCALPILLVSLGMGSVVAAVTLQLLFLVTLSQYKGTMFSVATVLLVLSAWFIWHKAACPANPSLATRCRSANALGKRVFWIASSLWLIGFVSAYVLLPLRQWLDV